VKEEASSHLLPLTFLDGYALLEKKVVVPLSLMPVRQGGRMRDMEILNGIHLARIPSPMTEGNAGPMILLAAHLPTSEIGFNSCYLFSVSRDQ
jgi:hypothetical protein